MQWFYRICGHPDEFEVEFQVLNWVLVTSTFLSVLLTIENLILRIPSPAAESTLLVTAITLGGYNLVRIRKKFSRTIAPLLYGAFLLPVTFIWFDSNGLEGAIPYFYMVPILAGAAIMHGRLQRIVLSATILHLLTLIAIETIAPQLISPYPSKSAEWLDTLIGVIYTVSYGLGYILILVNNLNQKMEKLRRSEMEYRQLFENSPLGVFRTTVDGKVLAANNAILKMLKSASLEDISRTGVNWLYVDPEDRVLMWERLRSGPVAGFETVLSLRDGGSLPVSISGSLVKGEEGGLIFEGTIEDITVRKRAEEALRESEEKLRLIVNTIPHAVSIWGMNLRCTYISPSIQVLLGYTPEEVLTLTLDRMLTPESLGLALKVFREDLEQERTDSPSHNLRILELDEIHKDGTITPVENTITFLRDARGGPIGIVILSADISERRRASDALRESEERYKFLVENTSDIIWIFDLATMTYSFGSHSLERVLGYAPDKAVGLTLDDIFSPETRKSIQNGFRKVIVAGSPSDRVLMEAEHIARDGGRVWMEINAVAQRDERGNVVAFIGASRDISERKRVEAELKKAEEKFRTIVNTLPQFISIWDMNMKCTYVSPSVQHLTGYTPEERLSMSSEAYIDPEYLPRLRNVLMDALVQEQGPDRDPNFTFTCEIVQIRKDGSRGTFESTFTFLRDETGAPISILAITADIADRKRAERELKEAKDSADGANRSKSVFLANMSHEIRTPMNAILGFSQLMERDSTISSQSREYLGIINRSGEHLLSLINDVLEMSKIEAGRATFIPKTFDLHALVQDIERMFRIRIDAKGLAFVMELIGPVPRLVITDEGKLRQIIINLLGNAVKFTEKGGIALRLRTKSCQDVDDMDIQFEVEDTGPGMTDAELSRLFNMFEQTSAGIKSGGTGLGLALSRGFIHVMGGNISVSSVIGEGTVFQFIIPVREGRVVDDAPAVVTGKRVLRLQPDQKDIRILIADDRETNRQLLSHLLRMVGFTTREAVNGEAAVQLILEWKPALVLMDMVMPVMDGYEATRIIRASMEMRETKILAVTASAFEDDKQRIFSAGADDYLSKPFKDDELFEKVCRLTGVQYLYREENGMGKEPEKAAERSALSLEAADLPPDLVQRMREAVERADLEELDRLVEKWAEDHPVLARQIREMAARYEYEALTDLFTQENDS